MTQLADVCSPSAVAPHAGAWIETSVRLLLVRAWSRSPPTRGRGLKPSTGRRCGVPTREVAPHAGAWIETVQLDR